MIGDLAMVWNAEAVYAHRGPPFLPFLSWAQRCDAVAPSPLGLFIHPDFGLWHAYRAALLLADRLDLPAGDRRPSPCVSCVDQPCRTACPVPGVDLIERHVADCAGGPDEAGMEAFLASMAP